MAGKNLYIIGHLCVLAAKIEDCALQSGLSFVPKWPMDVNGRIVSSGQGFGLLKVQRYDVCGVFRSLVSVPAKNLLLCISLVLWSGETLWCYMMLLFVASEMSISFSFFIYQISSLFLVWLFLGFWDSTAPGLCSTSLGGKANACALWSCSWPQSLNSVNRAEASSAVFYPSWSAGLLVVLLVLQHFILRSKS